MFKPYYYKCVSLLMIAICGALVCGAIGCSRGTAGSANSTPKAEATAEIVMVSPAPVQTPIPQSYYAEAFEKSFEDTFELRFYDIGYDFKAPFVSEIVEHAGYFMRLSDSIKYDIEAAAEEAFENALGYEKDGNALCLDIQLPSWKYFAAFYVAYGLERSSALIESAVEVSSNYTDSELTVKISFTHPYDVDDGGDAELRFSAQNIYAYLVTVYDDNCEEKEYSMPELPQGYLESLAFPLKKMYFYDSWYGPRQKNTRYHLGMDIRSEEYSDIYSCCDGIVTAIGTNTTAGNYVVIEDKYGYRYHYYHMVVLTDFLSVGDEVAQGDLVGYVGNTGNSDRNHLHLSIVNENFVHFNPYIIMCELKKLQ